MTQRNEARLTAHEAARIQRERASETQSPQGPARIIVVDDDNDAREPLVRHLQMAGHHCWSVDGGSAALDILAKEPCDLVVTDLLMPHMSGIELLERITELHPEVAVVVVTGLGEPASAIEAMKLGAYDYLLKPVMRDALLVSVDRALERRNLLLESRRHREELERRVAERSRQLLETYQETIRALGSALDTRDPETQEHALRVVQYSVRIATDLGLRGRQLLDIERGAVLHDIGKIGIPDSILLKPAKLTDEEWAQMRTHPEIGYRMLVRIRFLQGALDIVRHHHERFDGNGYPAKLAGKDIPIGARIFAIADTLDAMTSDRPYRKALPLEVAQQEVRDCSGTQFDPEVVEAVVGWTDEDMANILDMDPDTVAALDALDLVKV